MVVGDEVEIIAQLLLDPFRKIRGFYLGLQRLEVPIGMIGLEAIIEHLDQFVAETLC